MENSKIVYSFGSKGLDPMKMVEDEDKIYILDHIFSLLDKSAKQKVYMCEDCGVHALLRPISKSKYMLCLFKKPDDAVLYSLGQISFNRNMFHERMISCGEFAVLDILT